MAPRGKTVQLKNMYVADFETCDAGELYKIDEKNRHGNKKSKGMVSRL
jgi:hypothetical protein